MENAPSTKRRITELDSLRGLAALGVVFFHYVYRYDQLYGHSIEVPGWFSYGSLGVAAFFILSGFVIFMSIERIDSARDFAAARLSRLYPAYWAGVILTFTVVSLAGLPNMECTWGEMLMNLTMLQEFIRWPHVDGVYWTLEIELVFYFLAFLYILSGKPPKLARYVGVWLLLATAFQFETRYHWIAELHPAAKMFVSILRLGLILEYANLFAAGICFYKLSRIRSDQWGQRAKYTGLLYYSLAMNVAIFAIGEAMVVSSFYLLFWLMIRAKIPVLNLRPLLVLGAISYPLYLVHQNIGYILIRYGYELGIGPIVSVSLIVPTILLISWLIHHYIEMPGMRWLRARYRDFNDRLQANRSATSA
jgi:peptidoglycan/LPS O-acetylase OafA/YrhL